MKPEQAFILVVDDNDMNCDLLVRRLQREGHQVAAASDGRQALVQMEANRFDVVLLDIMMPEMNGFEVLERLKAEPEWQHIPVIVVSAADDMASIIKGIELGAEDYLTKPVNPLLLQARVNASLERKRLHDSEQARLAELATMQQIDRELNATLDVKRAMEITLAWAMRQSGGQAGLMGTVEAGQIQVLTAQGYSYELAPENNLLLADQLPAVQAALRSEQLEYIADTSGAGLLARTCSQIAVPIHRESAVIAMLLLESTVPDRWRADVLRFLNRLGNHAAMAIANAQLYEAVQAANNAKTEFVSFVSHELKIPMTSIKGYADLLLSANFGDINEAQSSFLKTILNNVERMTRLVSDLTDISRIESGHLNLQTRALGLPAIVEEVVRSTQAQIEEREQKLTLDIPTNLPEVWGDRTRLIQILTNLVSNAYKYTPANGLITIRAEAMNDQNGKQEMQPMVHISVADTGLGIKDEDQKAIFTKFFRANDDLALKAPGTGLGLNITKNLVEMHDGRIWFESKYREGTTFHIVIPAAG
jgi:signal transduction histidine kinase